MAAIILGWNPDRWNDWDYDAVLERVAETGQVRERWSIGRQRNVLPGTDVWLFLQGQSQHGRGLIGHGLVASEPYAAEHYSDPTGVLPYVSVVFDAMLPLGSQVPLDVLAEAVPAVRWRSLPGSGRHLPPSAEPILRRLWQDLGPIMDSDPISLTPGTYPEGAVARVEVNRYERGTEARRVCLAYHGTSCDACGFSFEVHYGEVGKDFIHVHHIVPVARLGAGYTLDPIADLVPLCANCHSMAHLGVRSPRTVSELRALIAAAGHLPGQVVDQRSSTAQDDAARILGQQ
ncbi:MAG TPA: HNH endonuclease [Arthrobacter sp.]|jgi:5-methylcytosine-specific restriction protein A